MRSVAIVLCVALALSLAYVPQVQAAPGGDDEQHWAVSVAILVGLALGVKYMIDKGNERLEEQAEQARLEREAIIQAYADENPDVDPRIINMIRNKQVATGMTSEQVRMSWGEPTDINRTVRREGTHEQWVYRRTGLKTAYVYVENGIVTTIQN